MTILKCFCFEFALRIKSHAEQAALKQFSEKENSVSPDESTGKLLCVETQTFYHSSSCIMNHWKAIWSKNGSHKMIYHRVWVIVTCSPCVF